MRPIIRVAPFGLVDLSLIHKRSCH
jgi:hypothetical protein